MAAYIINTHSDTPKKILITSFHFLFSQFKNDVCTKMCFIANKQQKLGAGLNLTCNSTLLLMEIASSKRQPMVTMWTDRTCYLQRNQRAVSGVRIGHSEILEKLQDPFLLAQPVLLVLAVADVLCVFCKTGDKCDTV